MRALRRWCGAGVVALLAAMPSVAADADTLVMHVDDPRGFGHLVGDIVTRRIVLDVPRRLELVGDSVPVAGRVGQALDLRKVEHDRTWTLSGTRHTLRLHYQIFHAPREPRVLDLPTFTLRFEGTPRPEELRVDFAPIGVSPLAPVQPALRAGLGTLRPDVGPLPVDAGPERKRLVVYAVLALLPLGHLFVTHLGAPWWQRRHRPFALARRHVKSLSLAAPVEDWLAAWRATHAALDRSAGQVMHVGAIDRYLAARPRQAALRAELVRFFDRSQAMFFRGEAPDEADRRWLRGFLDRCFDIERGVA